MCVCVCACVFVTHSPTAASVASQGIIGVHITDLSKAIRPGSLLDEVREAIES